MKQRFFLILLSSVLLLSSCGTSDKSESTTEGNKIEVVEDTPSDSSEVEATAAESEDFSTVSSLDGGDYTYGLSDSDSSESASASSFNGQEIYSNNQIDTKASTLTAGQWNDNNDFSFILGLMQSNSDFINFQNDWRFDFSNRIKIFVQNGQEPLVNAEVKLYDEQNNIIFEGKTNNKGIAYLFFKPTDSPAKIEATKGSSETVEFENTQREYEFNLNADSPKKALDLMFVIDTTGSMDDELEYIKVEIEDIVSRVKKDNANIDVRLSMNVYRDVSDDYVTLSKDFSEDINEQKQFIAEQTADGGGDFEEAVEIALDDAINEHTWSDDATAKLIFLVLDAPPHNTDSIQAQLEILVNESAKQGIRIIPIASSGINKNTEFLMRTLSIYTGGTYVFLTDDSGVGESHVEPTIGAYELEYLNDLVVKIINSYLE